MIERVSTSPLPYCKLNTPANFSSSGFDALLIYVATLGTICSFAKEHIVPKVATYIKRASKPELEKFAGVFNLQYGNGDVDTRSIITVVILNSLSNEEIESLFEYFDDDLKKASKAARKYKCKNVKPEKPKKRNVSKATNLKNS